MSFWLQQIALEDVFRADWKRSEGHPSPVLYCNHEAAGNFGKNSLWKQELAGKNLRAMDLGGGMRDASTARLQEFLSLVPLPLAGWGTLRFL